jgi:hypothetical protein
MDKWLASMQFLDPQMTLIKLSKNKMVIWLALTL